MSSRALRRAQKEREAQLLEVEQHSSEDSGPEDGSLPSVARGKSAFELLGQIDDEDGVEQGDEDIDPDVRSKQLGMAKKDGDSDREPQAVAQSKRKKKKKKSKKSDRSNLPNEQPTEVDEIDAALKELSASNHRKAGTSQAENAQHHSGIDPKSLEALAIDIHHLNVRNEMKRLFGDISFDDPEDAQRQASPGDQIGLAEAVKGVNSASGSGLPSVLLRRNIFVQGKEDWPKASGGGLSMEIEETQEDGAILFRFVHSKIYQSAQREFDTCVQTMDPSLMVSLLRFSPYHISTLLQVSEIAKQEKDFATAGDLIERALFSFGRALHPKFSSSLAQGKARLDFRRPENREFYLATWRYIQNISMRATWRTAYEWAKLVFQMDPITDPYAIKLSVDQFALRARQHVDFWRWSAYGSKTSGSNLAFEIPNVQFSRSLAEIAWDSSAAEASLRSTISRFPWVAARLLGALDVSRIPPGIWGAMPPSERSKLHTELYATQAIDVWKQEDAKALLLKAAESVRKGEVRTDISNSPDDQPIETAEGRHILLLETPALIALLPNELTSQLNSTSDVLAPEDDIRSYDTGISRSMGSGAMHPPPQEIIEQNPQGFIEVLAETHRLFELLIPGFNERLEASVNDGELQLTEEDIERAYRTSNLPPQRLNELFTRVVLFRQALANQPGRRVEGPDGTAAYLTEGGSLRIEPEQGGASAEDESAQERDSPLEELD